MARNEGEDAPLPASMLRKGNNVQTPDHDICHSFSVTLCTAGAGAERADFSYQSAKQR